MLDFVVDDASGRLGSRECVFGITLYPATTSKELNSMSRPAFLLLLITLGLNIVATGASEAPPPGEWRSYAADGASTKYSPLAQITRDNVQQLKLAWRWPSVDGTLDLQQLRQTYPNLQVPNDVDVIRISNLKATPLMVGGVLYISTPLYQAAALDAATGTTRWTYDP
jgi:quinoprotein glucose dehydrogenase